MFAVSGLAVAILFLVPAQARSQSFPALGTRALGMGGAFVAVADDASAVYWNPAGLATGPLMDFIVERQEGDWLLDGLGQPASGGSRGTSGTSYAVALGTPAAGLSYYRLRTLSLPAFGVGDAIDRDSEAPGVPVRMLLTQHFGVTLLQTLTQGLTLGTTMKVVRGTAVVSRVPADGTVEDALATSGLEGKTTTAFDLDAGLQAVFGAWRLGLVARNLRHPDFEASGDALAVPGSVGLSRQFRAGIAFAPRSRPAGTNGPMTIAADFDLRPIPTVFGERRDIALGGEGWWFGGRVGARAGVRFNTLTRDGQTHDPVGSIGLSLSPNEGLLIEGRISQGRNKLDESWGASVRLTF